jgi:serine/threonine-protein kinase
LDSDEISSQEETISPAASTPRKPPPSPRIPGRPPSGNPLTSSDPISGSRFFPGQIIAERYRVVSLAGRGGMGEVYRAEDLKLSQVVAIKFLPDSLSQDAAALARFHAEVRTARQVSHPNVCRVFDIGEADGILFLTMEYVDGEDLASVVRRIGRLSPDKASELARQICAGLAASHERGVIHRDLKPANVMLDGAGKIRITDFGLASLAASIKGAEARAGTPAYMSPEQLAGREVTAKSDIYSLGLVLYEILTGKRAFEASTLPELMKQRESGTITNPSTLVHDLDPMLERVILRCLENDPEKRPVSALQVAAALPGGDPLAAALAAGETPSPEMVAAAGETAGLSPLAAFSCLVSVLLGISLIVFLGIRENGLERLHPENSPEILSKKTREILASLGYADLPADKASGFGYDSDFLDYVEKNDKPSPQWNRVIVEQPRLLNYWYRQSPQELNPDGFWHISLTPGVVTSGDPPPIASGMINLSLDPEGRLIYFQAIPPEKEEHPEALKPADWSSFFAAAGIDPAHFRPAASTWNSLASPDTRAAWDGVWPGSARPLHIEAGAWHGKPVFFSLTGAWTVPPRMKQNQSRGGSRINQLIGLSLVISLMVGGSLLAYKNYVRGKGDRQGALRLASVVFALEMLIFVSRAHFIFSFSTLGLFLFAVSTALFVSCIMWMLYLALEPYVRRHWPQTIISWSRLLSGRLRDPLVGRDLLSGVVLGTAWSLVFKAGYFYEMKLGVQPTFASTEYLLGSRETAALWFSNIVGSILGTLAFFFVLVFLRILLRNRWLAAAVFVLVYATPKIVGSEHALIDAVIWVVIYSIAAIAVVRFGLIVLAMGTFMANVLLNLHYTFDFSNWYATNSLFVLLTFVAIAAWGFHTSLGGRALWKEELFE